MTKPIAVIILNWNGAAMLQEFLPKVIASTDTSLAEIIVADNGSDDNSMTLLADDFPQIKVIRFDQNYGFAEGYNRAIQNIPNPYVILLNSDVAPAPDWIGPLYRYMEAHPQTGACQPKILSYRQPDLLEYAGACGGFLDKNGFPYCRGRIFADSETDHGQYDSIASIFWASGAALTMRTDIYRQLGGLDPLFFAHMEEIDLCCRMLNAGWRVCAVTDSKVYHVGGASLNQGNPRKTYLNFRNNLLLLHKNLTRRRGRRVLFLRRLADTLAFGMFLLKGDMANARAVLRAHRDFRKMRREYTLYPDRDILPTLPGSDLNAVTARYLQRKKVLKIKEK